MRKQIAIFCSREGSIYDPVLLPMADGSKLHDHKPRVVRHPTIDGSCVFDVVGQFDGDRSLTVRSQIDSATIAQFKNLLKTGAGFFLATAAGVALGMPGPPSIKDGYVSMEFMPEAVY